MRDQLQAPVVLVVARDTDRRVTLTAVMGARGYGVKAYPSTREAAVAFADDGADLAVVALPLGDMTCAEAIRMLRLGDGHLPVVVIGREEGSSGSPSLEGLGPVEYLPGLVPDSNELLGVVGVALGSRRSDVQLRYLRRKDASGTAFNAIVGESPAMKRVVALVRQICMRSVSGGAPSVLVLGETGTGKGLIAKVLHYNGARRSRAFVDLNCAAVPATLLESELFGHERGAFTDARAPRAGLVEVADGGTLFLDEIGSMPLELQGKLLTAIEQKQIRRLGAARAKQVDVQIIAATNRDLAKMADRGEFRPDLYHRLNVVPLRLPPLRERGTDRVLLANTFLAELCREYGLPQRRLLSDAIQLVEKYAWPGNVRELRNRIERVLMLEDGPEVTARSFELGEGAPADATAVQVGGGGEALTVALPESAFSLDALEREVLRQSLEKFEGNVSAAARYLSISRQTLMYRMRKFGLDT